MKKRAAKKKLALSKSTVAKLNKEELNDLRGGFDPGETVICCTFYDQAFCVTINWTKPIGW